MTITALLGMVVTFALGAFMYERISDGLVSAKVESATVDASVRRADAQDSFSQVDKTDTSTLQQTSKDIVSDLSSVDDLSRGAILQRAIDNPTQAVPPTGSRGMATEVIPNDLRRALARDPEHQQTTYIEVPGRDGSWVPAVLVGSRLEVPNAGAYDLYLIYPMAQEVETISIIRQSFVFGGFALVVILAGLAYMVTRMVVTPVRQARHVAERLSAGALNERMHVAGEDDLARLANSFNTMAGNLQKQIRQLEELSVVQQRFTSDVSHELRTPLTTIRMAADLLYTSREDFPAPTARSAELLNKELDRFESLLADLLEISRFDAGAANLDRTSTDLSDLVRQVVDAYSPLAERLGTRVTVDAPTVCIAEMDVRRVERIVRNLVTNAIEHSEGKPIKVTVRAGESAVAVAVRDHGVGMSPTEMAQVFTRFWRADPARARTTGGTGLGLSIALEDARLHAGWLQAWGEPGEGSCFRLTLPLAEGEPIRRSPVRLLDDSDQTGPIVIPEEVRLR
ncbi:MtrAB system histidine kinase MtrB [Demetria terragena]|uniref:MtrAB system histidine kinase MtrB n=1 Tax=Demetria terragena TaxID=63959 RepID=UPI001FE12A50|nr:MtrAB system histidine kinase MtrB [Demetria terragena]